MSVPNRDVAGGSVETPSPGNSGEAEPALSPPMLAKLRLPATVHLPQGDVIGFTRAVGLNGCALDLPELTHPVSACRFDLHVAGEKLRARTQLLLTTPPLCLARFISMGYSERERLYRLVTRCVGEEARDRDRRVPVSLQMLVRGKDEAWKTRSVNLSVSGALVFNTRPLTLGDTYSLRIYLGPWTFETDAKVVRVKKESVALRFDPLPPEHRRILSDYLEAARAVLTDDGTLT